MVANPENLGRNPDGTRPDERTLVLVVDGPIAPEDIPGMCERLRRLLERSEELDVVVYDVRGIERPDATAVDALARLQLTARRQGRSIQLSRACQSLRDVLTLVGLEDVLPLADGNDGNEGNGQGNPDGGRPLG